MLFLNPSDTSGLGIYSKTAKNIVQRMPVLAKKRRHSQLYQTRDLTEQDQDSTVNEIHRSYDMSIHNYSLNKKANQKGVEPFTKSLSRQQRAMTFEGKNKNPAVGSYHPKLIKKQPKMIWNIIGAYQRSLSHQKKTRQRKQKVQNRIVQRRIKKQQQLLNPQEEGSDSSKIQNEPLIRKLQNPRQVNLDYFKYRNCSSFIDMDRMLGRQSSVKRQYEFGNTMQSQDANPFLTYQSVQTPPKKFTVQFNKQLSRQKVSSLFKPINNLVYDCNYDLVTVNNKIGPNFRKMVNRDGRSVDTELYYQQSADYTQIWLNRNKSSLPNLQQVLQKNIRRQKNKRLKTDQDK